jgi:hypothetical protein
MPHFNSVPVLQTVLSLGRRVGNAIFISYRRDDTEGEAGRLFDDLTRAFGNENVFMDVAGIRPGADFRHAIGENVAHCGVLLSIIGPTWAGITSADGKRRIEDPNDFVALEIASALKREVPVIPVLVHGAHMPTPDQLPDSLKDLSYRNSVEISHARWNSDVQLLIQALGSYVTPNPGTEQQPVHATVPVQLPAPHPVQGGPPAVEKSKLPLILGVVAVVLVALVAFQYFLFNSGRSGTGSGQPSAGPSALIGTWKDPNPRAGNSLSSLTIAGTSGALSMHAVGTCQPSCDWGAQPATFDGVNATATFNLTDSSGAARAATVTVHSSGSSLDVAVNNTFTDSSGSRQNQVHRVFVPGP